MRSKLDSIIDQDARRSRALVEKDWNTLKAVVHPELIHIHANGDLEGYAAYFHTVTNVLDFVSAVRDPLIISPISSEAAIAYGTLRQAIVHKPSGNTMQMEAMVTQLWVLESGCWRQRLFQASADLRAM